MAVDYSKYHSILDSYEPYQPPAVPDAAAPKQNTSTLADFGTDLKRGVQQVPSAITGLLDIPVAAVTGRPMVSEGWDELGKLTGFQPKKWSDEAQAEYSPARQEAQRQAAQAEGFVDTAGVYLSNPSMLAGTVLESAPGIALGGAYARGLKGVGALSGVTRAGIGEGAVMGGQSMNQMVEDGADPRTAAGFAAGVGAIGGALGVVGGSLAQRMGLIDPDSLAAGVTRTAAAAQPMGLARRVAGGAVSEGLFEELPQTMVETVAGNLAAERAWDEDLGKNAAVGLLAGGLMGGVVNIPGARRPRDLTQDAPQGEQTVEPSALEAALRTDTVPVQQWIDQQLNIGASPSETRKNAQAAFQGKIEPQIILDENGTPKTTTSAFDVYEFQRDFDARVAKQGSMGQTTAAPQVDRPTAQDTDPAVSSLRDTQYAKQIFKQDGAMRQNAERAWQAYRGFSGAEIDAAIEELAPNPGAAWRIAMLETIRDQRVQQAQPEVQDGQPAQVDAAGDQRPSAVAGGSAGDVSGQPDVGNGVGDVAGTPAPSSGARAPLGATVAQSPAGVAERLDASRTGEAIREVLLGTDAEVLVQAVVGRPDLFPKIKAEMSPAAWRLFSEDVTAARQGDPTQNVSEPAQVAPQAQEARGQEGAQDGAQAGAEQSRDAERAQVSRIFDSLSEREREVLTKYHFDKMTFEDIGAELKERGESGTTRQRIEQQHKEALKKLAEAGRPFGLTPERLRLYFPDESRRTAGGADVQTASAAEVAQAGAGMTYRNESNNGAVNQANDEFEMADAVDGAEALDLDTDIAREEFDEGFRGERGADADVLEEVDAVESMVRTERDHKGLPLQPVDFEDAASDYDLMADEGDTPFAELPRQIQVQWVKAWVAAQDGALTDQQLVRVFSEIANQYVTKAQTVEPGADATAQGVQENARGESQNPTGAREEVTSTNPLEARVAALRELDLGEKQTARLDKLVRRYQNREIYTGRLGEELQMLEEQAFPEDKGGKGMRYSRTSNTQGTTVEAVRSAINAIATPMGRRKITVYQTADEAVQSGALNSKDAKGTQGWVDDKGNAFFIAGNIPNGSELAVVLHEIGAHLGIEKLLTDAQYEALVKKIFAWAQSDANTQEAKIARAALARVDAAKLENEADLAPETIAYFIEEAVKAGVNPTAMQYKTELGRWFRTLWAAFKVALRRLNLINADRLTAQNVVDLAYGAARIELASAYHGTAANFRRFDHRYMGSGEGAQAFGWGTYLAQRFGIANEYWEQDVKRKTPPKAERLTIDGIPFADWAKGQHPVVKVRVASALEASKGDVDGAEVSVEMMFALSGQTERSDELLQEARELLNDARGAKIEMAESNVEGNIHITDINATEDELLDWDKPLSEQSEVVKAALARVGIAPRGEWNPTGMNLYRTLQTDEDRLDDAGFEATDRGASEYLDSLGIKGIKFLDALSRNATKDWANFPRWEELNAALKADDYLGFDRRNEAIAAAVGDGMPAMRNTYDMSPDTDALLSELLTWLRQPVNQTRNLVIFNDRNIYRVGSMRGGPVGKGGRMMFSKAADPQLVELAQESGQRALKAIQAGIRKGWTGLAFSSHLADAAHRAGLTSARALELVQRKKATRAYEIQIEVEKVLSKFADLKGQINGRPTSEVVQRFIYDSTFDKKWGFAPDWKQDAVVDPEMESRFNALPTEAQTVIKDVFRHGDAIFREKQDLLRKTITGEYEALIKAETDDGKRRKLERQRDKELREAGRLIAEMNGPYAPLRRYGNYVVVAKSQKYRDAEAAGPVDAELKRDENHYVVEFAETLYEAERLQGVLEGKFGKGLVWAGEKETATEQFGELPFMAVQRLRKMVDTDLDGDLNTKSKRVLNKLLVDLYISTLHEANARHSEQKRQFVNRADRDTAAKDMMRAFATQGRADSHLVSALQFNSEIVDEMQKLRNEAKNGQGDSLLKTRLRNEILQRHMMDLDFRETPVQDKLMSLNSFWMLLTSPGYYVQNATQVMMMTQPVLAGKFGQNRSMRQLMRGYQDAMRVLKGSSWNEAADLSRFNGTADEKAMLVELQARGTLDFGISAELGYWESRGEISKVFNQVMRKVGMATRKLEVLNRMSSALAAYRLMYDQTTGTQAKRHAAALDYADSIIKDTHGDYSSTNAPRYLRMMPKVMTQFRKFQLIQLSLFAKVIHGSIKGANPQEKRAMRAALGYLFMNHALLAGAVGVPASALLGAIYAIAGDDDDPNDWEVDVRRAIGDKEMADLILHGLPSLININMSNKIGAGTMLDPLPFAKYEATRGGYEKAVTAAMGPLIGGLGAQAVDAFGRILNGDVAQGTAQLLPRGFRDAARGFMAAQDGIKLRNGQTALTPEELSFYDSLMMGLGLPTLKTTSRTETQFKSQQYEQFFKTRVTKIKRQYSEAYEENDREAMLEARQAWAEMQASRKNLGFKVQPLSDLLKAPREKAKAEAKLENGIRTTEQARGFVRSLQ